MPISSPSQPPGHNLTANNSQQKPSAKPTDKQQRLARALRDNLLRRKASQNGGPAETDGGAE